MAKHCMNCGKKLRFWEVHRGPTGIFCSSKCFIEHWKHTPMGMESRRLDRLEAKMIAKLKGVNEEE